jgi:hypothetical protein
LFGLISTSTRVTLLERYLHATTLGVVYTPQYKTVPQLHVTFPGKDNITCKHKTITNPDGKYKRNKWRIRVRALNMYLLTMGMGITNNVEETVTKQ